MRTKISDEQFWQIKNMRSQYSGLTTKEFARMVFAKGITNRVLSCSTLYYIFPASSPEDFRHRQANARKGKSAPLEENVSEQVDEENDSIQPTNENCENDETDAQRTALLDELRHTNHLVDALFSEMKNQSRLIKDLIDLWRR